MKSLIDDNLDIVFKQAKRLGGVHWQDYVTSGFIGLHDAASKFKTNGGASFRTYAYKRVTGSILDDKRATTGVKHGKRNRITTESCDWLDQFASVKQIDRVASDDEIGRIKAGLLPRQQMTVAMLADGMTCAEAARATGFSEAQIYLDRRLIARRMKERAA